MEVKKTKPKSKPKISIQKELGIPEVVSAELLRKHQLEYILMKKYLVGFDIRCRFERGTGIINKEQSALRRLAYSGLDFTNSEDYDKQIKDLRNEKSELKKEISRLNGRINKIERTLGKAFD